MHPAHKAALLQRITPNAMMEPVLPLHKTNGGPGTTGNSPSASTTLRVRSEGDAGPRMSSGTYNLPAGYTPFLETMDQDVKSNHVTPMRLPSTLTTEDFTRAVAVATVSALRHQRSIIGSHAGSGLKSRPMAGGEMSHDAGNGHEDGGEGGSHEAPSWTRGVSAGVLLACTLLYAVIAGTCVSDPRTRQHD